MLTDSALCSTLALLDRDRSFVPALGCHPSIGAGFGCTNPNAVELLNKGKPSL